MNIIKNPAFYICIAVMVISSLFLLVWEGDILLNDPSRVLYPVRGTDVSAWQGDIDWEAFSREDIQFAFIKATEGSSHVDEKFAYNWDNARKHGIKVGAYHFFSYDSSGAAQAEHFIRTVPNTDGILPPVIDVEFYGDKEKNPPEKAAVTRELTDMTELLTAHYGASPIIYATQSSYDLYIAGEFLECGIWIREVLPSAKPTLSDGREWTFWQYTNRYKPQGLSGGVRFVDMNVFAGSMEELESLIS